MQMGDHFCFDGHTNIVHGTDTGAASASIEQDAKALVNLVVNSSLPFWSTSEPDGRVCGPDDSFRPESMIAFLRSDVSQCFGGVNFHPTFWYMFVSSLSAQCYFYKARGAGKPTDGSQPCPPSTWTSPTTKPEAWIPDDAAAPSPTTSRARAWNARHHTTSRMATLVGPYIRIAVQRLGIGPVILAAAALAAALLS